MRLHHTTIYLLVKKRKKGSDGREGAFRIRRESMALTRGFKETVEARAERDVKFRNGRSEDYYPSPFNTFTNSPCTNSFPHTTSPVVSALSCPSIPVTIPPASRTMICPAAMSHGERLRSQ
jgi:hypothetical protein